MFTQQPLEGGLAQVGPPGLGQCSEHCQLQFGIGESCHDLAGLFKSWLSNCLASTSSSVKWANGIYLLRIL